MTLLWRVQATDCAEGDSPIGEDSTLLSHVEDSTESAFDLILYRELQERFRLFLEEHSSDLSKVELFLPDMIGEIVREGKARVTVLPTEEKWYGVTYQNDRPTIQAAVCDMVSRGLYPENLWAS